MVACGVGGVGGGLPPEPAGRHPHKLKAPPNRQLMLLPPPSPPTPAPCSVILLLAGLLAQLYFGGSLPVSPWPRSQQGGGGAAPPGGGSTRGECRQRTTRSRRRWRRSSTRERSTSRRRPCSRSSSSSATRQCSPRPQCTPRSSRRLSKCLLCLGCNHCCPPLISCAPSNDKLPISWLSLTAVKTWLQADQKGQWRWRGLSYGRGRAGGSQMSLLCNTISPSLHSHQRQHRQPSSPQRAAQEREAAAGAPGQGRLGHSTAAGGSGAPGVWGGGRPTLECSACSEEADLKNNDGKDVGQQDERRKHCSTAWQSRKQGAGRGCVSREGGGRVGRQARA